MSKQRLVFKGCRFDVHEVEVPGSNGINYPRQLIVHPGAVTILPILSDGRYVLIRNQRFAVNKELLELPAGTLEPDEPPASTAARELIEETGYEAGTIRHLLDFYPSPGISNERMYTYVATDLRHVGQQLDAGEQITVELFSPEQVMEMIKNGKIEDAKSIATLLYYQQFKA